MGQRREGQRDDERCACGEKDGGTMKADLAVDNGIEERVDFCRVGDTDEDWVGLLQTVR